MRQSAPKRPRHPGCIPATDRRGSSLQECSQGLRTVPKRIHGPCQFPRSGRAGNRSEPGGRPVPGFPNLRLAPPNRILDLEDKHNGRRPYPHFDNRHARFGRQPHACHKQTPSAVKPQHGTICPRLPCHPLGVPDAVVPCRPGGRIREHRPCPKAAGLDECTRTCLHNVGPPGIAGRYRQVQFASFNRKPEAVLPSPPQWTASRDHDRAWQGQSMFGQSLQ